MVLETTTLGNLLPRNFNLLDYQQQQQQQNQTSQPMPCIFPLTPEFDYTGLAIAVCIVAINCFILFLFYTKKALHRLSGNYILASLSVNDCLNGFFLLYSVFPQFYLHNNNCQQNQWKILEIQLPTIGRTVYRILMLSSILHLVLLFSDRLVYIVYALEYETLVTKRRILRILAILWLVCITSSSVQLLWSLMGSPLEDQRKELKLYHTIFLTVLFLGLPSIILLVQSVVMVKVIRRLDVRFDPRCLAGKKAFLLYVCIYIKFVLFSYPYFIISLLFEINPKYLADGTVPITMVRIFLISRFLPSLVNPFLYSLRNKDYRKAIKTVLREIVPSKKNKKKKSTIA